MQHAIRCCIIGYLTVKQLKVKHIIRGYSKQFIFQHYCILQQVIVIPTLVILFFLNFFRPVVVFQKTNIYKITETFLLQKHNAFIIYGHDFLQKIIYIQKFVLHKFHLQCNTNTTKPGKWRFEKIAVTVNCFYVCTKNQGNIIFSTCVILACNTRMSRKYSIGIFNFPNMDHNS